MSATLRRVGLIGDVHAEDRLLARTLEFLGVEGVDAVLCAGDVVDGPGDVTRSCQLLADAGAVTVRGNHDRWILAGQVRDLPDAHLLEDLSPATARYLSSLPATVDLQTVDGPLLLCHGIGSDDMAQLKPGDFGYAIEVNDRLQELISSRRHRFVICGHSHVRMVRHFGDVTFINAGTLLGERRPGFALLAPEEGTVQFFDLTAEGVVATDLVALDGKDWPKP